MTSHDQADGQGNLCYLILFFEIKMNKEQQDKQFSVVTRFEQVGPGRLSR